MPDLRLPTRILAILPTHIDHKVIYPSRNTVDEIERIGSHVTSRRMCTRPPASAFMYIRTYVLYIYTRVCRLHSPRHTYPHVHTNTYSVCVCMYIYDTHIYVHASFFPTFFVRTHTNDVSRCVPKQRALFPRLRNAAHLSRELFLNAHLT